MAVDETGSSLGETATALVAAVGEHTLVVSSVVPQTMDLHGRGAPASGERVHSSMSPGGMSSGETSSFACAAVHVGSLGGSLWLREVPAMPGCVEGSQPCAHIMPSAPRTGPVICMARPPVLATPVRHQARHMHACTGCAGALAEQQRWGSGLHKLALGEKACRLEVLPHSPPAALPSGS